MAEAHNHKKQLVTIGGGTGSFTILNGLKALPIDITAIVSTADNGGSSGQLRDEMGILPPGDIRQAIVALAEESSLLRQLFTYRFASGSLHGHQFGNLFIGALTDITGSFDQAVREVSKILNIQGHVVPVTIDNTHLWAETKSGKIIEGESAIEEYQLHEHAHFVKFWLQPTATINPDAVTAIAKADLVVIGPGSTFTSIIPNLLVDGMKEALAQTNAQVVYITNLMTEKGWTGNYTVHNYVRLIEKYIGKGRLDYVLYNTQIPSPYLLEKYRRELERRPVKFVSDSKRHKTKLIGANLLESKNGRAKHTFKGDHLANKRTLIRHDSHKLAKILYCLMEFADDQELLRKFLVD